MPTLNRRDFLKALGITSGASALSACGLDGNRYPTPVETILPYVVKPEQVTPGTYTFFATTVTRGPHALPVTARHRDGRVTTLSANFGVAGNKPPTGPAIPPSAFFELQRHYSPDRRKGPSEGAAPITWDQGLSKLADAVKGAQAAGKKVVYLGGYKSGAITELIRDFTSGNAIFWEPAGYAPLARASELLFGRRVLPFYSLDKAGYILSFGAPFLGGWGDADIADRFAKARNPNVGHQIARFAAVQPSRDQTAAKADDYYPCAAGAEVLVARAVAAIVAQKKSASDALKALIGSVAIKDAASASGLSEAQITAIAEQFASNTSVALPGGANGSTDLAAATLLLNLAGGGAGSVFDLGGYGGPISDGAEVEALISDMSGGQVGVLLIDDANPVYALPPSLGFEAAMAKVGLVVSLSSHGDETSKSARLVLPGSDPLEDWGDEHPFASLRLLRQPAMSPLYDTRSVGDVLLGAARAAGLVAPSAATGGLGFESATWREYLEAHWQRKVFTAADGSFTDFWERSLVSGFLARPSGPEVLPALVAAGYAFDASAAAAGPGEVTLHVVTHPLRQDGRYANQSWSQEVADPMTGLVWDSWLELNEETAKTLGLGYDDMVEVTTELGTLKVGVLPFPGIRADHAVLALGQGHTSSGRYADGYGANAFSVVPLKKDGQGVLGLRPVKATIKKTGEAAGFAQTSSIYGMSDEGRNFGVSVSAQKLAAKGDAPAAHPGELTGVHLLEMDKRLQEQGISDFYMLPDHPTYRFGLTVDTNACTGCNACSVACYAENNLAIVGKAKVATGREMAWLRVNRYWERDEHGNDDIHFVPLMCQQCGHAGCENVCPVLATYHTLDGLNAMVYNRCVGTRYCSNACPYSARRFNFHTYKWPESLTLQLNPDVLVRQMGVMEKCTFCVQRIRQVKAAYRSDGNFTRAVPSEALEQVPACVEACPSQALVFGNLKDENSKVTKSRKSARSYELLTDLNMFPAVNYLAKASFHHDPTAGHGGGGDGGHAAASGEAAGHGEGKEPAAPAAGH